MNHHYFVPLDDVALRNMVFYLSVKKMGLTYSSGHERLLKENPDTGGDGLDDEYLPTCCRNGGSHKHPV